MSDVGTQKDKKSAPLVERVQGTRESGKVNPPWQFRVLMGRELSTEASDFTLPRKAASENQGARTANRHR